MMNLIIGSLESFDSIELYKIMKLRVDVFVVEQTCPYEELDGKDQEAMHICLKQDDDIVAYLRVLPPGISYQEASIGRVLVNKEYRGKGYGTKIMEKGINYCIANYASDIKISAQAYLETFYESLGFTKISDVYLEDDIPHMDMIYYN